MRLETFKVFRASMCLCSWLLINSLTRAFQFNTLLCSRGKLSWRRKAVQWSEGKYGKNLRLSSEVQSRLLLLATLAEDETLTFFLFFLLLVSQALHSFQSSESPTHVTSSHPTSSRQAIKPSTSSSSKPKEDGALLNLELERIRRKHTILASTGCTRDFCQSGRMIHTDEPRGV